jgi:flagellar biosynthesis/type III secretory pathway protein FliH
MSIIKSANDARASLVRAIPTLASGEAAVDPRRSALERRLAEQDARIAALTEDLATRDARIARLTEGVIEAHRDGVAEGREAGLREADDRHQDRLAKLAGGIEAAVAEFAVRLSSMERLAVTLAGEGLAKIIGAPQAYGDLLAGTIRHHAETVGARAVVRVTVSQDDFPTDAELAQLRLNVANGALDLRASPDLSAGACEMRLRLGALDIGVDQQWDRLRLLFDELSLASAAE